MKELTNYDIAVVGSGVSGLASALTAAETGARVVVFEKELSPGGTSNFFQGTFAVETRMQKEKHITYDRDAAFKGIMDFAHWQANPRLVRAVVNASADTIYWLQKQGVEFTDVTNNLPDIPRTYHVIKGEGAAVVKILVTRGKEKGVDFRFSTPVKRLLKQGNHISGVVLDLEEEEKAIQANAVIIASGGYVNNKEWMRKYSNLDLGVNVLAIGNVGKMGDGIRMAWEAGAAEEGIGPHQLFRAGPVGPDFPMGCSIEIAALQPDLWVDPRGLRFCDETIGFFDTLVGNAAARYKEGFTYSLFDDSIIQRLIEQGPDKFPWKRITSLKKEMQIILERGSTELFSADTIEVLARNMGIDPSVLKTTVDEYNRFCTQNRDDLFAKNPKYLRPLTGPLYYAAKTRTVSLGSMGGIKINEKTEVVDKQEKVISGLYAVGYDAGGMFGDNYPITPSSGLSSGFAINSGRFAGHYACEYLGKTNKGSSGHV
jgi:fumarate reductase flavoprotein subunit